LGDAGEASGTGAVELSTPDGEPLAKISGLDLNSGETSRRTNIVLELSGLEFPQPGDYRLTFFVEDSLHFQTSFEVILGTPEDFA
jgi:hypothetical protein